MIAPRLARLLGRADFRGPLTAPPVQLTPRHEAVLLDEALADARLVDTPRRPHAAPAALARRIGQYMEFHR